jgi:hypothetical protein
MQAFLSIRTRSEDFIELKLQPCFGEREFAFPKDASVIEQEACHTKKATVAT